MNVGVLDAGEIVPILGLLISGVLAAAWLLSGIVKSIAQTRLREQTRREIAAYVAEGTITPEHAERLLKAEPESASKPARRC